MCICLKTKEMKHTVYNVSLYLVTEITPVTYIMTDVLILYKMRFAVIFC